MGSKGPCRTCFCGWHFIRLALVVSQITIAAGSPQQFSLRRSPANAVLLQVRSNREVAASPALEKPTLQYAGRQDRQRQAERHGVAEAPPTLRNSTEKTAKVTPAEIVPADLWAIHDLVLLGYYGVMLKGEKDGMNNSKALLVAQSAAENLSVMLPVVHPVAKCRTALSAVTALVKPNLSEIAETSWTCLGLSKENFTGPFTSLSAPFGQSIESAHTAPKYKEGACKDSLWPRGCSFWASFHTMGLLADVRGIGKQFFNTILQILASGPLFCVGCTKHVRLLAKPILPADILDEDSFAGV
mmetsp:Transcript_81604/g.141802  ORF Transcript_81604/g.141802 Transcript_81604/m.141802 type:complete len:300 (+) Transcript_81604:55-954(+)